MSLDSGLVKDRKESKREKVQRVTVKQETILTHSEHAGQDLRHNFTGVPVYHYGCVLSVQHVFAIRSHAGHVVEHTHLQSSPHLLLGCSKKRK